jgi:hypothetical protein
MTYLELGESQLAGADFRVLQGSVGYGISYYGGFDEAEKNLPEGVSIIRTLSASKASLGNTVTVTTSVIFDRSAPVGYYHISQIVPTGLRFVRVKNYNHYEGWYFRKGDGGMIDFYINPRRDQRSGSAFNEPTMPGSITIVYEARAVLPGTYIMEATTMSYSGSNILYADERSEISIE